MDQNRQNLIKLKRIVLFIINKLEQLGSHIGGNNITYEFSFIILAQLQPDM